MRSDAPRDVGIELDTKPGVSGNRIHPVHRYRLAAQKRLKHRHHLVGLARRRQELSKRVLIRS